MSERTWNRREFGRAVAPALVAAPGLATLAGGRAPAGEACDGLWPEAQAARDFYRRHLPAGHRLAAPTLSAEHQGPVARRSARLAVLDGSRPVGFLRLDATFAADNPAACLGQGTVVAGAWYGPTVANAIRAGRLSPIA